MPVTRSTPRKQYVSPDLKVLGDVATLTREHTFSGTDDSPFGSVDEIKSGATAPA